MQFLFSLAMVLLPFHAARSIPVENLYIAEVLVPDESARRLKTAAKDGLLQVLVRVSGSISVEQSSLVRSSLRNPAAYYDQYSYESSDSTLMVNDEEVPAKLLRLHFDPSAVARLLRDANLPVWGSNRPGVLVWVALSDAEGRRILSESDTSSVVRVLMDQARQRGLPLYFPILDLEDAARISTAEVWGAFLERIDNASTRYRADSVLTARIQQELNRSWTGRWSYQINGTWQSIESVSFSPDQLARDMVNRLADDLASRFALEATQAKVKLVVEGVFGVAEYAALSDYLEQLTPVLSSSIITLEGDVAEFELRTEGQYEQLVEVIELDQRLVLLNGRQGRLLYRWTE